MAADVQIVRLTGAGPSETTVTNTTTRLSTSDDPSPGSSNPIPIPASDENWSYWGTFQLKAETAPDGEIDNLRFHTDGANSFGTGVTLLGQAGTYVQADGDEGISGDELTTGNHAGITGAPVNPFTWTSGSPKTLTGSQSGTGRFGQVVVLQLEVASTASPGTLTAETFTFVYDET